MATDMHIKFSDNIEGEAGGAFDKQVKIISWNWGMTQSGDMHSNLGGGSGKVDVQNLTFTHYVDLATPNLLQKCCDGTHIKTAELTACKAGGTAPVAYLKIAMQNCIVAGISTGGAESGEKITETVTLNFRQFKVEYSSQNPTSGQVLKTIPITWNIPNNRAKLE